MIFKSETTGKKDFKICSLNATALINTDTLLFETLYILGLFFFSSVYFLNIILDK